MSADYSESEAMKMIGERLIAEHHSHLVNARIAWVIKEKNYDAPQKPVAAGRVGKKKTIAKARLTPAVFRLLSGYDFVIQADEGLWDLLTLEGQRALIDHELCHCMRDSGGWYIQDHDVEEFRVILERHGFWRDGLEDFVKAGQAELPFSKDYIEGKAPSTQAGGQNAVS